MKLHLLVCGAFGLLANVSAATLHVSLESTNPVAPYASWGTAATVIQDAVDAAKDGDTVLVGDGVYGLGLVLNTNTQPAQTNYFSERANILVPKSIALRSVNGPTVTLIDADPWKMDWYHQNAPFCLHLSPAAVVEGFTVSGAGIGIEMEDGASASNCILTANGVGIVGGKVYNSTMFDNDLGAQDTILNDCTLAGNTSGAWNSRLYGCLVEGNGGGVDQFGGIARCTAFNSIIRGNCADGAAGAWGSTLYNCILDRNVPRTLIGAAASDCALYGCTVVGNRQGIDGGKAINCIVYYNGRNYHYDGVFYPERVPLLNFTCTTPLPAEGFGNIESPPLFRDLEACDFRLREQSPCIDAGTNLLGMQLQPWDGGVSGWVTVGSINDPTDILGNARGVAGLGSTGAWDMGAYEFNSFLPPRLQLQALQASEGLKLTIHGPTNRWVWIFSRDSLATNATGGGRQGVYIGKDGVGVTTVFPWEQTRFFRVYVF